MGKLPLRPSTRAITRERARFRRVCTKAETGTLLHVLEDHRAAVEALAVSADGKTLAHRRRGCVHRAFGISNLKALFDLPRAGDRCRELAFSIDRARLVCRYENNIFEFLTRRQARSKSVIDGTVSPGD